MKSGKKHRMRKYQPAIETFDGFLSRENKVIARDCMLKDLKVTGAVLGGQYAIDTPARAYNLESEYNNDDAATVQLQAKCADALKCVRVVLSQIGSDVAARIESAAYVSPEHEQGFNFPRTAPLATNAEEWGYGVAQLSFTTSFVESALNTFGLGGRRFDTFLSKEDKIIASGVRLCDLTVTGARLQGGWIGGCVEAKVRYVKRSQEEMSVQLQRVEGPFLKCVHITLRQVGNDVTARADWAAYVSVMFHDSDFSKVTFLDVAESNAEPGYGVANLSFSRKSLFEIETWVAPAGNGRVLKVKIQPFDEIEADNVRIGLHWLKKDGEYGGYILDKMPYYADGSYDGESYFVAEFALEEVAGKMAGVKDYGNLVFPVVFFADDGSFDNAWYKSDLAGARNTEGMIIPLYLDNLGSRRIVPPNKTTSVTGEPFELNIDGSNVVRHSKDYTWRVLKTLLDCLDRKNIKYHLFFDATVVYLNLYKKDANGKAFIDSLLADKTRVTMCPAGDEADSFILFGADKTGAHVLSDDRFSQEKWQSKYPWVNARNDDGAERRVHKFSVKGNKLLIPDLDVFEEIVSA